MHNLFVLTTADSDDPDEMPHTKAFHSTLFAKTKTIFREKTTILFGNCNL